MWEKYPNISAYAYCALNPVKYIDPTGMFINPIYDLSGNFLGTDDKGLQGFGFAMEIENFKQGMKHSEAMNYISAIPDKVQAKISAHVDGLKNRPDYDGFVTIEEGINWAKEHPYALENPTPDNSLYINTALLNFGNISSSQLNIGKPTPVNLFNVDNFAESLFNSTLRATIYALGRVNIMLESNVDETFRIINDSATDYDWNKGGGFIRDNFIKAERYRTGLDDRHGFKVFYYGLGKLNRQLF
ncbi:hypothetical protein FACS1894169_06190 [Bacteroidia bacterium]|nr:hypothetical protein FACS1894169_06190 [Bacteroidia bacterium]